MIFDDKDSPVDFVYLAVNSAFERLTGLKNVQGKPVTEVIPGIRESSPELFEIFSRVALTGQPEKFEIDFKPLSMWLSISVISPGKGYFVCVFDNITESKHATQERERLIGELQKALSEVKTLSGLLPICANCKKIRDDKGYWNQIEGYIQQHSDAQFSHGICPDCIKKLYPEYAKDLDAEKK